MRDYPALSIRQPWAGLIMAGVKSVENRTWVTAYRGPLYVHATSRSDIGAMTLHGGRAATVGADVTTKGAILGTVELVDIREGIDDEWAEPGRWNWVLSEPRRLREPVVMTGRLGLWRPAREPPPALW